MKYYVKILRIATASHYYFVQRMSKRMFRYD